MKEERSGVAAGLGMVLLRPLEPMGNVASVTPVPLLMINGTEDEQVPRRCAEMLYAAAGRPRKIVWIESAHVHPRNVDLTRKIVRVLKEELARLGML
ncbi:MAG: alpha/beta hydrolase [Bacteroidota bacterium]